MKGIQYLTDDKGRKVAVMIDLGSHGRIWEDFFDCLTARKRAGEPRESLEAVRKRLKRKRARNGRV